MKGFGLYYNISYNKKPFSQKIAFLKKGLPTAINQLVNPKLMNQDNNVVLSETDLRSLDCCTNFFVFFSSFYRVFIKKLHLHFSWNYFKGPNYQNCNNLTKFLIDRKKFVVVWVVVFTEKMHLNTLYSIESFPWSPSQLDVYSGSVCFAVQLQKRIKT